MKYLDVFKLGIKDSKYFRSNFYFGFLTIPTYAILTYFLWRFGDFSNKSIGFTEQSIISYFIILQIFTLVFQPAMYVAYEMWDSINDGSIIVWMTKPINLMLSKFMEKFAAFIIRYLPCVLIIGVTVNLLFNVSIYNVLYGAVSGLLGFILLFLIQYLIGIQTFWFKNIISFRDFIFEFFGIIGGTVLPIDFFPNWIKIIAEFSPLPYIYYAPSKIISGAELNPTNLIFKQLIWIIILYAISNLLYSKGRNKVVQGG
ncbi:MAG: ABC-2 family transporter protein [Ezakiella sp.]|nr:ABC-2 family transporter protein [Ezakiella sp.]MDD7761548.1 ABC-2 family transporter protein [Bacillota bacterium]MDY3947697.1 ABC-2 family transporter protein [Ezakiella sp.]